MNNIDYKRMDHFKDMHKASKLIEKTWGPEGIISPFLFIAQSQVGACLLGAYDNDHLIGFNYGFIGKQKSEFFLYSHMLAIDPDYQGYGIGERLKEMQMKVAEQEGYKKVVWTFDPLQSKNAYFNFHKLGAISNQYKIHFYGKMENQLNTGTDSDRLLVEWEVNQEVRKKRSPKDPVPIIAEIEVEAEIPVIKNWSCIDAPAIAIPIPTDIQQIKTKNTNQARKWQQYLRETLSYYFNQGYSITDLEYKKGNIVQHYTIEVL